MKASRIDLIVLRGELASRSAEIARALLGEPNLNLSTNRQLRFGRKGSLVMAITGLTNGSWYDFENDVGGDLVDLIRREHGGSFRAAVEFAQRFISHERILQASSDASAQCRVGATGSISVGNQPRALELWEEGLPIIETAAAQYLAKRGIVGPALGSEVLRFHPSCPYGERTRQPCMLALLRDIHTNEARAIHRTALTAAGDKIGRMVLGPKVGAAVKLSPDEAVTLGLTIAEGIETALSGIQLGWQPAWSVVDAAGIAKFPVLPGIEALTILVDNDESGTGQRRAIECSDRWTKAGREVLRVIPRRSGDDLNDIVRKKTVA
jgi:putative DNA primase/helicase